MKKKERVMEAIAGKKFDYTPSGFWLHFPLEQQRWENALEAHLEFMKDTDTDICKVMNEALLRGEKRIEKPSDYRDLKITEATKENLKKQVEDVYKRQAQREECKASL